MKTLKDVESNMGGDYLNHKIETATALLEISLYCEYSKEEIMDKLIAGGFSPDKSYLLNEREREDFKFLSKEEILSLSEMGRVNYLEDVLANTIWSRWSTNSIVWQIYEGILNAESDSIDPDMRAQRRWLTRPESQDGEWADYLSDIALDKYLAYYNYFINDPYFLKNEDEKIAIIEDCFLPAKNCPIQSLEFFAFGLSPSITNKTLLHPNASQELKATVALSRMRTI